MSSSDDDVSSQLDESDPWSLNLGGFIQIKCLKIVIFRSLKKPDLNGEV